MPDPRYSPGLLTGSAAEQIERDSATVADLANQWPAAPEADKIIAAKLTDVNSPTGSDPRRYAWKEGWWDADTTGTRKDRTGGQEGTKTYNSAYFPNGDGPTSIPSKGTQVFLRRAIWLSATEGWRWEVVGFQNASNAIPYGTNRLSVPVLGTTTYSSTYPTGGISFNAGTYFFWYFLRARPTGPFGYFQWGTTLAATLSIGNGAPTLNGPVDQVMYLPNLFTNISPGLGTIGFWSRLESTWCWTAQCDTSFVLNESLINGLGENAVIERNISYMQIATP